MKYDSLCLFHRDGAGYMALAQECTAAGDKYIAADIHYN